MGVSLLTTGDIAEGSVHFDRANALYDPAEHRPLATRFGVDSAVLIFGYRSWASWLLGYPEAAHTVAQGMLAKSPELKDMQNTSMLIVFGL